MAGIFKASDSKLAGRLAFIAEIDKIKQIFRQTYLMDHSRKENDAEHSWHLAMMAIMLADYANEAVDLLKVIKMVLVHDLVEIDAGDTFCYDEKGNADKAEREQKAADRIFGIPDTEIGTELRQLWDEFELRQSPEAKFAAALDRIQPLMCNYATEAAAWREHSIRAEQVFDRNCHIAEGSEKLWQYAESFINDAINKGWLKSN